MGPQSLLHMVLKGATNHCPGRTTHNNTRRLWSSPLQLPASPSSLSEGAQLAELEFSRTTFPAWPSVAPWFSSPSVSFVVWPSRRRGAPIAAQSSVEAGLGLRRAGIYKSLELDCRSISYSVCSHIWTNVDRSLSCNKHPCSALQAIAKVAFIRHLNLFKRSRVEQLLFAIKYFAGSRFWRFIFPNTYLNRGVGFDLFNLIRCCKHLHHSFDKLAHDSIEIISTFIVRVCVRATFVMLITSVILSSHYVELWTA